MWKGTLRLGAFTFLRTTVSEAELGRMNKARIIATHIIHSYVMSFWLCRVGWNVYHASQLVPLQKRFHGKGFSPLLRARRGIAFTFLHYKIFPPLPRYPHSFLFLQVYSHITVCHFMKEGLAYAILRIHKAVRLKGQCFMYYFMFGFGRTLFDDILLKFLWLKLYKKDK